MIVVMRCVRQRAVQPIQTWTLGKIKQSLLHSYAMSSIIESKWEGKKDNRWFKQNNKYIKVYS